MHAGGLHSALAIRRERQRRRAEQHRTRDHHGSIQSSDSGDNSPHCSTGSLSRRRRLGHSQPADNDVISVCMLHLGVFFIVLGALVSISGWLTDATPSWISIGSVTLVNELVCLGFFATAVGIFLINLHKCLTKSEERALEVYVEQQLSRSISGRRLERDAETGGMRAKIIRPTRPHETELLNTQRQNLVNDMPATVGDRQLGHITEEETSTA